MNVCQQHVWHRSSTGWKQEDDPEGWSVQREYQTKQCSNCSATLFIRPLGVRRCYRLDLQSTEQPALLKNLNAKQWRTIEALIPKMNRNRFEVLERLSEWAEAGWVEVEETWIDPGWQIERVRLSPLLVSQKTEQQDQAQDERERQAIAYLLNVLHQWRIEYQEAVKKHYAESDLVAIIERLYTLFEEQERALDAGTCVPLAGTTMMPGGSPHQRWLALLRGILDLLAKPRLEHERIFSAKWLHDSKAFRKERDALEAFLSIEGGLQRVGLVKHTPVVLSWGAWQAAWNGFLLDGQAAFSFAAMPADTLAQVHEMQVEARSLFIVENQTPFEILVHPQRRDAQTLYLYGAGFPGQAQRELTALWLHTKPAMPWSIWTDYDLGGVAIQQHWHNWSIQEHLSPPHPYRWTLEDLALCQAQGVPLKDEQRVRLNQMQHPLAQLLCEWGYTIEQEALLSIHTNW